MSKCTCKEDVSAKLLEHARKKNPDHTAHEVTLEGYGLVLTNSEAVEKPFMPVTVEALRTTKGRIERKTKSRLNMFFSFCPFCGVLLKDEAQASRGAPASAEVQP